MKTFEKTISTNKSFDDAVAAVEKKTAEKGFQVLYTHDVAATLAEKGFAREPLKIIEICNAKYASQVLDKEVKLALMMPCPITSTCRAGRRKSARCYRHRLWSFSRRQASRKLRRKWKRGFWGSSRKRNSCRSLSVPDSYCRAGRKNTNALIATSERNAARMKTMPGCTAHSAPAISDAGR